MDTPAQCPSAWLLLKALHILKVEIYYNFLNFFVSGGRIQMLDIWTYTWKWHYQLTRISVIAFCVKDLHIYKYFQQL